MKALGRFLRDVAVAGSGMLVWSAVVQPPAHPLGDEAAEPTGLDLAYAEVEQSYAMLFGRFEAANARLQALESLALTLTLGVPTIVVAAASEVDFTSGWFYSSLSVCALLITVAFVARQKGTFIIPSPEEKLESRWLLLAARDYKYAAVFFAAEHFVKNRRLIYRKAQSANLVFVLLVLESVLLLCWLRAAV